MAACSEGGPTRGWGGRDRRSRLQIAKFAEELAHLHIGVDAEFELAAVGRAAGYQHLDPQVTLVRQADFQGGWFGHDCTIHLDAREQVAGAETAILLVGHRRHQHVAAQARV